jgi:hypothetical protein
MLYNFVEEFPVIEAGREAGTDRDCIHQYIDDIVSSLVHMRS